MAEPSLIHSGFTDSHLLKKIDALFACGVGEYIDLPQLVVVGQQSSGKSSVLEGLTSLSFPRDSSLCTQFTTQITFVRHPMKKISASVIPSAGAKAEHAAKLKAWSKSNLEEFKAQDLEDIIKDVKKLMGLREDELDKEKPMFSEDVLRLDVSGPDQQHLSVIDVPGIFKKATENLTTEEDILTIDTMVETKMKNKRCVILAVIPANLDIANQDILQKAKLADPEGVRTLGVLTKPDLVDPGAEGDILDLFEGKKHPLKLGWILTKNPGQMELKSPTLDRNALEDRFFKANKVWSTLDSSVLGVNSLRLRLQGILSSMIRQHFPQVKAEITTRLDRAKRELEELGGERQTPEQQRQYLVKASNRFQDVVTDALTVRYSDNSWFDEDSHRYATAVVSRNKRFAKNMNQLGHSYNFNDNNLVDLEADPDGEEGDDEYSEGEEEVEDETKRDSSVEVQIESDDPDLQGVTYGKNVVERLVEPGIIAWLTEVHRQHQGFELGTFQNSILAATMRTQTERWPALALGYISDIVVKTHKFIKSLLEHIIPDDRARKGIQAALMDELLADYKAAYEHVDFLLRVERQGTPTTQNHYFNDNLQKQRQERMKKAVEHKSFSLPTTEKKAVYVSDLVDVLPMANEEHVVLDIKDILQSYYKVARKRFVDNVCMQGADFHLVTGPKSPLRRFSPTFVLDLTPDQLEDIAGEDESRKRRRQVLQKEIDKLESGKKIM